MGVSDNFIYQLLYLKEKVTGVYPIRDWLGPDLIDILWRREKSLHLPRM
jgi:hypothetical protein